MHLLRDEMKGKYVALKRTAEDRMTEIDKSWKSYTCFSADYSKKTIKEKSK